MAEVFGEFFGGPAPLRPGSRSWAQMVAEDWPNQCASTGASIQGAATRGAAWGVSLPAPEPSSVVWQVAQGSVSAPTRLVPARMFMP